MILSESTSNHTHSGDTQSSGSSECRPKNLSLKYLIRYLPFEVSSSAGLTEEQSAMLILISDFIKANCKDNGDGTFDYSKFKSYTVNGETLWLSDELLRFVSKNYWQ